MDISGIDSIQHTLQSIDHLFYQNVMLSITMQLFITVFNIETIKPIIQCLELQIMMKHLLNSELLLCSACFQCELFQLFVVYWSNEIDVHLTVYFVPKIIDDRLIIMVLQEINSLDSFYFRLLLMNVHMQSDVLSPQMSYFHQTRHQILAIFIIN